ncbi:MAG: glycosyltransferase 61 family protein, partial [Candidatus ainarchaeum sp.]|nr:glycosyltransferase 61 family protein [Candidatus ainarchaeum sp.]
SEEFEKKLEKGMPSMKAKRKFSYFENHNRNDEEDTTIIRFLPSLKRSLALKSSIFYLKNNKVSNIFNKISKTLPAKLAHKINKARKRPPIYFDWNFYVNNYYDLQLAKINTKEKAVDHWIKYGKKEGRICSPIFAKKKAPKKENEIRGELEILNKLNLSKIRQKNPLSAELLKNANIIYCITDKQEKEKYLGVVDSSNNLNSIDLYLRLKLANLFFSPKKCTKMDYLDGEYIFAGYLVNHYGHFLVESINRAWYLKKFPNKKIIWITGSKEAKFNLWQEEILDILNIKNKYVLVSQPTKIETLIVPDAGFIYKNHFNCEHAKSIGLFDSKEIQKGKKVWLSRSGDVLKNKFTIKNEPELEKVLEKKGWIIFHPEQHSVKTQIKMICYAERIAGFMGSAFHSIIFLNNPSAKITIFNRNSQKIDSNYILIKTTKNLNQEERYLKLKQINNRLFEVNSIEEILKIIEN